MKLWHQNPLANGGLRAVLGALAGLPVILASGLPGCSSARRNERSVEPVPLVNSQLVAGQKIFMTYCQKCHPNGEAGLGASLNNKPLTNVMIRLQVRKGLGMMPAFPDSKISDAGLGDLVEYVKALRTHKKVPGEQ